MNTYEITYLSRTSGEPVLSKVIIKTKALVNILKADIDQDRGVMVINIIGTPEDARRVVQEFKKHDNVKIREIQRKISVNRDTCIDCGACIGLCPTNALNFDSKAKLEIFEDKCIQCKACVRACPMKALSIEE
ncbi:MAG: 4Fe-4S binding protein [Candidatus Altiarchaeota archaeon]|nr:4Fe-4S binding protein [Candidatus Altiarchaeota archaeon]